MSEFKKYRRSQIAELRPITEKDLEIFKVMVGKLVLDFIGAKVTVSISEADQNAGSPKIGDMVARNPKNHADQWLVAKKYFNDNFEKVPSMMKEDGV